MKIERTMKASRDGESAEEEQEQKDVGRTHGGEERREEQQHQTLCIDSNHPKEDNNVNHYSNSAIHAPPPEFIDANEAKNSKLENDEEFDRSPDNNGNIDNKMRENEDFTTEDNEDWLMSIQEAPTYRPTEEQFEDPIKFIESIREVELFLYKTIGHIIDNVMTIVSLLQLT